MPEMGGAGTFLVLKGAQTSISTLAMTGGHLTSRSHQSDRDTTCRPTEKRRRGWKNYEVPTQTNFAHPSWQRCVRGHSADMSGLRHTHTHTHTHTSRALRVLVRYVQRYIIMMPVCDHFCMAHGPVPLFLAEETPGPEVRDGGSIRSLMNKLNKMVTLGLRRQGTACINELLPSVLFTPATRPFRPMYRYLLLPLLVRHGSYTYQHGTSEQASRSLARSSVITDQRQVPFPPLSSVKSTIPKLDSPAADDSMSAERQARMANAVS